jgi:ABC-type sugar transport system ATPase subunit/ribose/xylose/arabinose/galactoside ABC-type transport system permease subunit
MVQLLDLSKSFPGVTALDGVTLELRAGSVHALLGENGAGKSTLINILSGVLHPDKGELRLRGKPIELRDAQAARALGIATVHQEVDLFPDLTVAENVALEHGWPLRGRLIDWRRLRQETREALHVLGHDLDPDRAAATLTAAERQLVGIAAALAQRASLLVLDEPTSSLSSAETQTLFGLLSSFRTQGGAVLYVSHRLEEVFELADEVTVLRDGRHIWTGPLVETTPQRLISLMVGRETVSAAKVVRNPELLSSTTRLACKGLTVEDGSFVGISLEVKAGEILGLYGLVGAGRSEWAQAVFGLRRIASGQIILDSQPLNPRHATRQGLAYLPEDRLRTGLFGGLSVRANTVIAALRRLGTGPFVSKKVENRLARTQAEQLCVRLHALSQLASTLSGGNQQKIVLGRWLACDPSALILDEPTRGVDVGAKAEIHALLHRLAGQGRALVLISSDLPEVLAHSDRIGVFRAGKLVAIYEGATTTPEQLAAAAVFEGPDADSRSDETSGRKKITLGSRPQRLTWLHEAGLLAAVVLLGTLLTAVTDTFLQQGTLRDIGEKAALLALCGLGAALVILAGGIDISFGSIMALGASVGGVLMKAGWPPWLAVAAGLAASGAAGSCNALLTLLGRVHPIVITLGTLSLYRGLTFLLLGGKDLVALPEGFHALFQLAPLAIPTTVWIGVSAIGCAWFFLGWTVPGRQLVALGGNPRAAAQTGLRRWRLWLGVFTIQGILAGLAGLLALAQTDHLQSTDFEEKTLEAIGVAVVGGIAITGGRGSVWGVCAAALFFRSLEKGWGLLHISGYWQRTIVGALLLLAILGDGLLRRVGENKE